MRLRVYVHRNLRPHVKDVSYSGENTGLMGVVANKGASIYVYIWMYKHILLTPRLLPLCASHAQNAPSNPTKLN